VIDTLAGQIGQIPKGTDRLVYGDAFSPVRGIAVAFMPTVQVLQQAISQGANLVIAHEGAFYRHEEIGLTDAAAKEPVFAAKRRLIEEKGLAVYRCHDSLHAMRPDVIMQGLLRELCWQEHVVEEQPTATMVSLPEGTVGTVAEWVKARLGLASVRLVGDPAMPCRRIGLLVGYRGGREQAVPLYESCGLDLILYGEGPEWETPEYVRDAIQLGQRKALLVLGHRESEQPGMKLLADWLSAWFPGTPVRFYSEEPVFTVV
jgi:putative NIF3 family GTP cyclohydrolase 1 type 2